MEGCHTDILKRLFETNMEKSAGYGTDVYSEEAREKIRQACGVPEADVFFLVGGTQTNAVMIDSMLSSYQGVLSAESGHIASHEAGAIEYCGHKVLTLPANNGKIRAFDIQKHVEKYNNDENNGHLVMPALVYISQPTECGSLYSLSELKEISTVCKVNGLRLYLDGARLSYALASPENTANLKDIASLCDAFYIGGTKCGALFGEAVVIPKKNFIPHFFTIIKQHGALLAKGRIASLQFDTLFTDNLYFKIGKNAIDEADLIRKTLIRKGYEFAFNSPTNQIFVILTRKQIKRLSEHVVLGFWENIDSEHAIMQICTSWATKREDTLKLIDLL